MYRLPVRLTTVLFALAVVLSSTSAALWSTYAAAARAPVILLPGMAFALDQPDHTWGDATQIDRAAGGGMIAFLVSNGFRFGGVLEIRGIGQESKMLITRTGTTDPAQADLFALRYSPAAAIEGITLKATETARAIKAVTELTGQSQVAVVAFSAGGLAARLYLQNGLHNIPYRGDVEQLITLSTPHLGSAIAHKLGDLIGTRATALQPDAPLIQQLNNELQLPTSVYYAAIVARGIAADVRGHGQSYDPLVLHERLVALPVDYRQGGDQVVHVRSQNLALSQVAIGYEKDSGKPVLYFLSRVPDPSPEDGWLDSARVHSAVPYDSNVQAMTLTLLDDSAKRFWQTDSAPVRQRLLLQQLRLHALGILESRVLRMHPISEVQNLELLTFETQYNGPDIIQVRFRGTATTRGQLLGLVKRRVTVSGTADFRVDAFVRIVEVASVTSRIEN